MAKLLSDFFMARLLLVAATMMIMLNVVFLLPHVADIPVHGSHYIFTDERHMKTAPASEKTPVKIAGASRDGISVADWMREEANLELTPEMKENLPTWEAVREIVGDGPVVLGLESCPRFREIVPPLERMLGSAGMFNTGTNLVTHLLKKNCEITERREKAGPNQSKESYGMRWQVPWGKHTPAKFRKWHSTKKAMEIKKEYILPVVMARHPYSWFGSMCKMRYEAKWDHVTTRKNTEEPNKGCPKLKVGQKPESPWNPVDVKYGEDRTDHHLSLAHLWNDWLAYYLDIEKRGGGDDFPLLVVRMEDLVFYPKETIQQVCECAGGKVRDDQPFEMITGSAKAIGNSKGHDTSTGIFEAWVKYSKPNTKERYGFAEADYTNAAKALDGTLMKSLGYKHPS